jgi:DNA mismatch endonuclease, patch repair protein
MMAGIRSKNTKPEIAVRKLLHALGYRFRLHRKDLSGRPDIVLPKWRAAILVHGCFWHGHEKCRLFRIPKSRSEFWKTKIGANIARDKLHHDRLLESGWRVLEIWECALKGKGSLKGPILAVQLDDFVRSAKSSVTIRGESSLIHSEDIIGDNP